MKYSLHWKSCLLVSLSFLLLLCAPALAQGGAALLDAAEAWDEAAAVHIGFDGDTVDIKGDGAALSNGVLTIDKAGTYVFTGTWNNGQVRGDADKKDTVRLVFNGVSIHCADNAPLYAPQADKVILTLAKGTENALSDGDTYTYPNGETEPDAALYVQDDLTVNGRGSLLVTARFKHGIVSKDDLLIENGILSVTAADVGIRGRDSLQISGGEMTVVSKGDALQSNNGEDSEKGRITLTGGTYRLTSAKDGIQAESGLTISGGDYTLYTGGVIKAQGALKPEDWQPDSSSSDAPGKGLKAGADLDISGGRFALYCADDAISADGRITIQDGIFEIATKDDGLGADGQVTISGGELVVLTCYEGIDAAGISILGGAVRVNALDDGFSADSDGGSGQESPFVRITGGSVFIKAMGDGIDSSGSVALEGGELTILSSAGSKSTVNFADSFLVSGGVLIAAGGSGTVEAPSPDSSQPSLMVSLSAPAQAGSQVVLTAEDGSTVLACAPEQAFQALLLSAPGLALEKSYTLTANGQALLTARLNEAITLAAPGLRE